MIWHIISSFYGAAIIGGLIGVLTALVLTREMARKPKF